MDNEIGEGDKDEMKSTEQGKGVGDSSGKWKKFVPPKAGWSIAK